MHSQNPLHNKGRSGSNVRHSEPPRGQAPRHSACSACREGALSEREFELLLEGARRFDSDYYYEADPEFIIYVLGRLGLRRGEIAHLQEGWIDCEGKMLVIPEHEKCEKAQGGGVCGYCHQLARQRVEYADTLSLDEALQWMWVPKTQASAREIFFGFDPRLELYIERYFDNPNYDQVEIGSTGINRRVKKAAEKAEGLTSENLSPHKLRATAATYHSGRGLETLALMQFFGLGSTKYSRSVY